MKKIISGILFMCLFLGVTGCGGSKPEDIEKKIEDANWDISIDKDAGTKVGTIELRINEENSFELTIYKDVNKVKTISYSEENYKEYSATYQCEEEYNLGTVTIAGDPELLFYNIDEDKFIDESGEKLSNLFGNVKENKKKTKEVLKTRDKLLDKVDLTLEELETWGNWYYQEHK